MSWICYHITLKKTRSTERNMEQLITYLKDLSKDLSTEDIDYFLSYWKIQKAINRNDYLLREGEVEKNMYFLVKGTLRIYATYKEQCEVLLYPNNFCNEFLSFTTQKPSTYYVQALKPATVLGISSVDFHNCLLNNRAIESAWRIHTERLLLYRIERQLLLRLSAKKRVERLVELDPDLFQHFAKKYIASYLHITPETFSRIIKTI